VWQRMWNQVQPAFYGLTYDTFLTESKDEVSKCQFSVFFVKYQDDEIKEAEMGGSVSMHVGGCITCMGV
jgi:hypothetical protein